MHPQKDGNAGAAEHGGRQPERPWRMADRRVRPIGVEQIGEAPTGANYAVGTAGPHVAEPHARGARGVELRRHATVETGRKARRHSRGELPMGRALGDDSLDAAVEITGAQVKDRQNHRVGMWTVSPARMVSDALAAFLSSLPSITR